MSALPSASSVIAAPDETISNFSSVELTSAATCGGWPARASTASQKSRCEPAEAGSAATGSLTISVPQARCLVAPSVGTQLHLPARLPLGELAGDRGTAPPDRGQRADPQHPRVLGGGVADHGDAVVPVLEQAAGHRVQSGAGGGELNLAPVTPEQLGVQRRFQAADLFAEGRLRQVQALSFLINSRSISSPVAMSSCFVSPIGASPHTPGLHGGISSQGRPGYPSHFRRTALN